MAFACASLFVACNDDNDEPKDIKGLQKVSFETKASHVIGSQDTGETVYDPTTSTYKHIYAQTTQHYMTISSPSVLEPNTSAEVIYPGSILRGSSFLNHSYDPLVLSNPFNQVILSLTLKGEDGVFNMGTNPTLSDVRATLNSLLTSNKNKIDTDYIPADYVFVADSISNEESFSKSFSTHVDFNFLKIVRADFGYSQSSAWEKKQKYIMVKLTQKVYSASINPKYVEDWVEGDILPGDCGTHEPVYISNVDYGRTAYFLLESNISESEASTMISFSVGVALGKFGGSTAIEYDKKLRSLFANNKVKVKIVGGSAAKVTKVTNYNEFVSFIQNTTADELVKASAPISYTVRRMVDNTKVDIVEPYKEVTNILVD